MVSLELLQAALDSLRADVRKLEETNVSLLFALGALTYMGNTSDGRIIIGPQGWRIAQEALAEAKEVVI